MALVKKAIAFVDDIPQTDNELNKDSENPIQNGVVATAIETINGDLSELSGALGTDEWKDNIVYGVGSYVIHDNKMWKCLIQNSGQTPTEGTYWKQVSIASEIAQLNSDLNNNGVGDVGFDTYETLQLLQDNFISTTLPKGIYFLNASVFGLYGDLEFLVEGNGFCTVRNVRTLSEKTDQTSNVCDVAVLNETCVVKLRIFPHRDFTPMTDIKYCGFSWIKIRG